MKLSPAFAIMVLLVIPSPLPAGNTPEWLDVHGHQRSRYESLDGQFRAGARGSDEVFVFRTAIAATVSRGPLSTSVEVADSRQALADDGTTLNTTVVNALELLQAYAAADFDDWIRTGSRTRVLVGRYTMDVGSRRLVARNRFRNTINSFTGLDLLWRAPSGTQVRSFYTLPIGRRPSDRKSLLDNDIRIDEESLDVQFWGVHAGFRAWYPSVTTELCFLGLREDDGPGRPTGNRRLYTAGVRIRREAAPGRLDFEIESAFQVGQSRASASASTDLDHAAHFQHAEVGYTLDTSRSARISLQFDHASGDKDPADGENNRFDTLYGARRFDFGPTGIYGAFARANIVSPGYRIATTAANRTTVSLAHRFYWLASETDAWTTSGVRDVDGAAGSYVGNQVEAWIRWRPLEDGIAIEAGAARLFAGEFMDDAPNANGEGDVTYGYVQTVVTF